MDEGLADELKRAILANSGRSGNCHHDEQRMISFKKGSIWWVKERVWTKLDKNFQYSVRDGHPGLCIRAHMNWNYVPFLLGTSKRYGDSFVVRGLNFREPDRITNFGGKLYPIGHHQCGGMHEDIVINHDKPTLSEEEMRELEIFLKKRHLA
jgi:hypothetical protein